MGLMVRTGILLNLIGVVLVTAIIYFLAGPMLGLDPATPPAWSG